MPRPLSMLIRLISLWIALDRSALDTQEAQRPAYRDILMPAAPCATPPARHRRPCLNNRSLRPRMQPSHRKTVSRIPRRAGDTPRFSCQNRAMRQLLLLRHAKSSWEDVNLTDHDRPLDSEGHSAAHGVRAAIARLGFMPRLVLVSSARRTRETLELLEPPGRQPAHPALLRALPCEPKTDPRSAGRCPGGHPQHPRHRA